MSDSIKAWYEMQEEKLASLKADEALMEVPRFSAGLDKS